MLRQPTRLLSVERHHEGFIAMPTQQQNQIIEHLFPSAVFVTPPERLIGCIGNIDLRAGRCPPIAGYPIEGPTPLPLPEKEGRHHGTQKIIGDIKAQTRSKAAQRDLQPSPINDCLFELHFFPNQ